LKQRGIITFWFDEKMLAQWHNIAHSRQPGLPVLYRDIAIECALTLRAIFHLPLRATEGFIESLIENQIGKYFVSNPLSKYLIIFPFTSKFLNLPLK
jgi:hypothetical protein